MKKLIASIIVFVLAHFALFSVALLPVPQNYTSLLSGPFAHFIAFFGITTMMYIIARHTLIGHQHPMFSAIAYGAILVYVIEVAQALLTSYRVYAVSDMMWGWAGILFFASMKLIVYDVYLEPTMLRLFPKLAAQD